MSQTGKSGLLWLDRACMRDLQMITAEAHSLYECIQWRASQNVTTFELKELLQEPVGTYHW